MSLSFPLHLHLISMHTSPLDQPGTGDAGGMNVYILRSLEALLDLNPQLTVEVFTLAFSPEQAGRVDFHPRASLVSLFLPQAQGAKKEDLPALVSDFARALLASAHRPPQLIHAHYWLSGQVAVEAYPLAPLVLTLHTSAAVKNLRLGPGESPEPQARFLAEQALVAQSDLLVVNTAFEAEQMVSLYGAEPELLRVIPPGVDRSVFRPLEGVEPVNRGRAGALHLVFAGRLQPLKGPKVLIEALGLLPSSLRVSLDIIGSSAQAYDQHLRLRAQQLGIARRVRFLPPLAPGDLAQAFRQADLVACPSSSETFGLVALEASASGAPVLATKVDGLQEAVLDGVTGLLLADRRASTWASALKALAADPQLRARLGRAGAQRAASLTWHATALNLLEQYRLLTVDGPDEGLEDSF